jgi:hypothetical protein
MSIHEGGCLCGAVRYRVTGAPIRTSVCHCKFCQRRTGSAFGVGVYFKREHFDLLRGDLARYEYRSDETGRWLRVEFCPKCGSTVTWTLEMIPDGRGVAAGSFDDTSWIKPERQSWTRSKQPWVHLQDGIPVFEKSAFPPTKSPPAGRSS